MKWPWLTTTTSSNSALFVCSFVVTIALSLCVQPRPRPKSEQEPWWGESSVEQEQHEHEQELQEPWTRQSKLYTFNSTSTSPSHEGSNSPSRIKFPDEPSPPPPFVTRTSQPRLPMPVHCIEGTAECIHAKRFASMTGFESRTGSVLQATGTATESRDRNRTGNSNSNEQFQAAQKPERLKNLYPTKPPIVKPGTASASVKFQGHAHKQKPPKQQTQLNVTSTNNTEGRIIAYKLNQTSVVPMQAVGSAVPRPTITLGQLARQVLFPSWFWTRFSTNRRIDTEQGANANGTQTPYHKSAPTTAAAAQLSLPSITFDNNISRFMKLFTLVRFPNTPCVSTSGRNGTCYHSRECTTMGGTAANSCASGFGVCCVFQNTCGQTTAINGTYFVDNGMVFNSNSLNTCSLQVQKISPAVKQMRLDFHVFSLLPPNAGNCELDRFIISGQNTNDIVPILCGENNGTHMYVETEGSSTGIQLSVLTTGMGDRTWSVRVTQIEAASSSSAPTNCLQYHTAVMGAISSFNYASTSSPQYLNNMNYAICIRKEPGFCSLTFTNNAPDGTYMPFQVVNANDNGQLVIPGGQAGIGVRDCPYDFLVINGYRLCGERFNDATTNVRLIEDAPVSDLSNGPFIVSVRTNELDVGGGFFLHYRQNPCMSTSG